MEYSLLQKLTIIINSYNRHNLLMKAIKYWSNYDIKVVVIDGSNIALKSSNLNHKNIRYVHDPRSLNLRLLNSFKYIKTEFMILGTDDDFYLPSALSSCVKFLSKENDYSSCGGCAIGFHATKSKKIFGKLYYPKLKNLSLDHHSASRRIKKHFSNYVPAHVYSVIRSDVWKIISKYTFSEKNNFVSEDELLVEFLTLVAGKSKIIPELVWLRNLGEPSVRGKINYNTLPTIYGWWFDKTKSKEKENFLKRLNKASIELLGNSRELTIKKISFLFKIKMKNKPYFEKLSLKYNIILNLSDLRYRLIRIVKDFILPKKRQMPNDLNYSLKLLESENVKINYREIDKIISTIENKKNLKNSDLMI